MKLISWNVNGLRATLGKGFLQYFDEQDADIFCIQETKMQPDQAEVLTPDHYQYWHSAQKKGYSGTAVFTKTQPLNVVYGLPNHMDEGRLITLEFDNFYFICSYTPNSQAELKRIDYRMSFEDDLRQYMIELKKSKPVILCGDLNVAHNEIDLKNPKSNHFNPGFSDQERGKMTELLSSGFVDSFRYLYPEQKDAYSWWSYRFKAREKNIGWRIDYFVVSDDIKDRIKDSVICNQVQGSDHCPVMLEIEL